MGRSVLAGLAAASLLILAATASPADAQRSNLSRTAVLVGVAKRPVAKAIPGRVFVDGATISVRRGSPKGPEITRAKADGNGRFMIPVAPGTYYLIPLAPVGDARGPMGKPLRVVARTGRTEEITLLYPRK